VSNKVKWGVIGCGGIADRRTLPGMMLAENCELVAVMDTNPEAASRCKEKYNAKYSFTTVEDILSVDEIEAVYIATPVFCHKAQVFAAADKGKHILLEKPVGMNVAEAREIKAYCEQKHVLLGVGFVMRFHNVHQKLKELVAGGKLGEIVSARAQLTCWYPELENCWRQDKKLSGGGALMDMGIHCVDIIRYITGLDVINTVGMAGNQIFKYGVEDAGAILMRLENGATAFVDANFNIPDEAAMCKLELYGTKGSASADGTISQIEGGVAELVIVEGDAGYDAMQQRAFAFNTKLSGEEGNLYAKEVSAFADAVLGKCDIPVTVDEAIKDQEVIESVYNQ